MGCCYDTKSVWSVYAQLRTLIFRLGSSAGRIAAGAALVLLIGFLLAPRAHADNCSSWRSPQKVWLNEYFFGSGGSAPPNFLEVYSTTNAFPASWQDWSIDVYSKVNTKTTYPLNNATATACTVSNKTWLTSNVPSGLRQQNALVVLKDSEGKYVDAFVFDNNSPPAPWPGAATSSWFPELADSTLGCPALAANLTNQANASGTTAKQANMLVLSNYGNKDMARDPDGGSRWDLTSNTGAGTTYTQCVTNNANFSKTVDNASPPPGSTVTFTLNLSNTASSSMSGVKITDSLPPVLTYISATSSNPSDPAVTTSSYTVTDPNDNQSKTATSLVWSPATVAAGTTSKLYIKMQVPNDAVPGHSYVNTAQTTAGLTSNQTDFANVTIGRADTPSFSIAVSPASATTCTPALSGPKVTITAMSAANGGGTKLDGYNGTVTLTTSSPNPKWYNSAGQLLSGNTVTLTNGSVTLYLTDAVDETFTVSAIDVSYAAPEVMYGTSGNITFSDSSTGLTLTDADSLSPAYGVVAGRPHAVKATLSTCGTRSNVTANYTGTMYYIPGLNHPSGAAAPTVSTSSATCPGTALPRTTTGTPVTLSFVSGEASFYLCTTDVGQYALSATVNASRTVTGVSSNFTVRPFAVAASGFLNTASASPGTGAFVKAGETFTGTLKALQWLSTADTASPFGEPDPSVTAGTFPSTHATTPSFSGTTNNAGVVTLAPVMVTPPKDSGTAGTLSPASATLSGGSTTLSSFSYSEVGTIKIGGGDATGAYAAMNYLGASELNVPIVSDSVGRITPDHFVVTPNGVSTRAALTCSPASTFTYMDEPLSIGFTITAQNKSNQTTRNYEGTLAFLDPANNASWTAFGTSPSFGLGALNDATALKQPLSDRIALDSVVSSTGWVDGVNTIEARAKLNRSTDVDGPFDDFKIGVAPQDSDGVTTTGLNLDADNNGAPDRVAINATAPTVIRFGRLRLYNAFGSEKSALNLPVEAQYWTGKSWAVNSDDKCTSVRSSAIALSNYLDRKGASASGWNVAPSGFTLGSGSNGGGRAYLTLGAPVPQTPTTPAPKITGSVGVCIDLGTDPSAGVSCAATSAAAAYLQGKWPPGGGFDNDPFARATFGVYKPETRHTVHVRERF
ncbi:MAG TPA: DUF6701 domain-containing protein [Noviherbaspirillum sp.]|nr:DUF6701 domain-containing protein [Noviherbaspirillum sp.]